jgi:O-antigen/teichoic acid export membrane protein
VPKSRVADNQSSKRAEVAFRDWPGRVQHGASRNVSGSERPQLKDRQVSPAGAISARSVIHGSLWNILNRVLPQLYSLVISVLAARILGSALMGRQSYIAFCEVASITVIGGGIQISLVRFVAQLLGANEPMRAYRVARRGLLLVGCLSILASTCVAGLYFTSRNDPSAWAIAAVVAGILVLHGGVSAILRALQQWRVPAMVGLTSGALSVALTCVVLTVGWGITGMFAVELLCSIGNLTVVAVFLARATKRLTGSISADRQELSPLSIPISRPMSRYALRASLNGLVVFVVWGRTEFFFLDKFATSTAIAIYSISYSATSALAKIGEAIGTVIAPTVSTLLGSGENTRLRLGIQRATRISLLLGCTIAALGFFPGSDLLQLVYGDQYTGSRGVFELLMISIPLLPAALLCQMTLLTLGHARQLFYCFATAACANIALDALLIPTLKANGAAAASATAQILAAVGILTITARRLGASLPVQLLLRTFVAMLFVVGVTGTARLWLGFGWIRICTELILGVVACGVCAHLFRPFDEGDLHWFIHRSERLPSSFMRLIPSGSVHPPNTNKRQPPLDYPP